MRWSALAAAAALAPSPLLAQGVSFSTVAADGYAAGDINSCAIGQNNLTTVGSHQFIAYYNTARQVMIGRREVGSATWQTYNSGYTVSSGEITDDHNVIGIAVDGAGRMHMSWNMHNQSLRYAISDAAVTGAALPSIAFTTQTAANAPTLFPSGGATTDSVTYPQFYDIPGSDNLLLTYRNGGAGGGSGNGNQYFNVYNPTTQTWTNQLVIDGEASSVNGYLNTLAYTSTNDLLMSWTWRATSNWQTNANIMFAQSPDNGSSWFRQGGATPYTVPLIQSGSPASSVAQVIKAIPQNSSLINQTSMTVDNADNPLIATWWAPNYNPATGTGDRNRQYMLVYYDGDGWRQSQVTNRTSDTAIDTSAFAVRDLGRPIVLVDDADRVFVVTRSTDTSMGAYSNPATSDNEIVVYYNTTDSLASATPNPWQSITLDSANMGSYEPTYDAALWEAEQKLALFYQRVGIGQATSSVQVLEWDPAAYFANLNAWNIAIGGDWDVAGNWSNNIPNAVGASANFGGGVPPSGDSTITISGAKTLGAVSFGSPTYGYSLVNGSGGSITLNNGASAATITTTSGNHTIAVPVSIGSAGVSVSSADGATLNISGNFTGSGGLTKTGAGRLVLSGNNTYGGATVVSGGTLRAGGSALAGSNLSLSGGILEASANLTRSRGSGVGQIQLPGGNSGFAANGADVTITINNTGAIPWGQSTFNPSSLVFNNPTSTHNVTLNANISLNGAARSMIVNAGVNTFSGVISSMSGSLNVNGPGTLVLSNTNTYGGGTILNSVGQGPAVVRAAANGALGSGTLTTGPQGNSTTARLELSNNITLANNINWTGRTNPSIAIENVGGNNTLSGTITMNSGGNQYLIESDAGTLTLSGTITTNAGSARTITLQGASNGTVSGTISNGTTVVGLTKSESGTWTISGPTTYSGPTTVNAGKLAFSSNQTATSSLAVTGGTLELSDGGGSNRVIEASSVSVTGSGRIDLRDNKLITASTIGSWNGSAYTGVTGLIQSGRAPGGGWTGAGIVTSLPDADTGLTSLAVGTAGELGRATFAGLSVSPGDTMVMYTWGGDANLDGKINVDDYGQIDFNVGSSGSVFSWFNGDFNYDGKINIDDYGIIDFNVSAQDSVFPSAGSATLPVSAVPEPSFVATLFAGIAVLTPRRRRE